MLNYGILFNPEPVLVELKIYINFDVFVSGWKLNGSFFKNATNIPLLKKKSNLHLKVLNNLQLLGLLLIYPTDLSTTLPSKNNPVNFSTKNLKALFETFLSHNIKAQDYPLLLNIDQFTDNNINVGPYIKYITLKNAPPADYSDDFSIITKVVRSTATKLELMQCSLLGAFDVFNYKIFKTNPLESIVI